MPDPDPAVSVSHGGMRVEQGVVAAVEHALDLPESERRAYLERCEWLDERTRLAAQRLLHACQSVEQEDLRLARVERVARADGTADATEDGIDGTDDGTRPEVDPFGVNLGALLGSLAHESSAAPISGRRLAEDSMIGPFRIVRFVAAGGMGEVYEAVDTRVGRRVALKTLPVTSGAERSQRFAREAVLMARLEHPAIARLYEWGFGAPGSADTGGTTPYIAMEFVEGCSLREALATRRAAGAGPNAIVRFLLPAIDAVAHAHARGVLHRDIKPSNVLVDARGTPRLLDFGVAALIDDTAKDALTMTEAAAPGTLTYMSPEQVRGGARRATTQSDVYALGLLVHEAIRGAPVVDPTGRGLAELIEVVLQQEAPRLAPLVPGVSGDLDFVIRKALAKEPERRYRSVDAFAEDLRRAVHGEAPLAREIGVLELLRRIARRERRYIAIGAVILLAIGAAVVFSARQLVRAREAEARSEVLVGQLLEGSKPILVDLHERLRAEGQPLAARRAALEATVVYLEWVRASGGDDVRVLAEVARRYRELASVAGSTGDASLGDSAAAKTYYLRSLEILDGILNDDAEGGSDRALGDEARGALFVDRSDVLRGYAGHFPYEERAIYYRRAAADQRAALALTPAGVQRDQTERYMLFTEIQAARLAVDEAGFSTPLQRMHAMAAEPRFSESAEFLSELGLAEYFLMDLFVSVGKLEESLGPARAAKTALERSVAYGQDDFTNNRHLARIEMVLAAGTAADRAPADSLAIMLAALERSRRATNFRPESSFNRISHIETVTLFIDSAKRLATRAREAGDADGARAIAARALEAADAHFAFTQGLPTEGAVHRGEAELCTRFHAARQELADRAENPASRSS